jgi:hypothetical protein
MHVAAQQSLQKEKGPNGWYSLGIGVEKADIKSTSILLMKTGDLFFCFVVEGKDNLLRSEKNVLPACDNLRVTIWQHTVQYLRGTDNTLCSGFYRFCKMLHAFRVFRRWDILLEKTYSDEVWWLVHY